MIVANAKPVDEVFGYVQEFRRVLVLGCGDCATVCHVGGEREVAVTAEALRVRARLAGAPVVFLEHTVQRQCEPEFADDVADAVRAQGADVVLSLGCGAGVNLLAERLADVPVFPGVDTSFVGATVEPGVWEERCAGCGQCILHLTGGICPIARCPKQILNGPCGGVRDGMCEISTPERPVPCVWCIIIERARRLGTLDRLLEIAEPKDWSTARDGGPRRRVREDLLSLQRLEAAT